MCHTWFDLDLVDRVLPPNGMSDSPSHFGGFHAVKTNPLTRELWMLRVCSEEDGKFKFIRKDGKFYEENQPTFDVLDENLQYQYSLRLHVPEHYKCFTIYNFFCTADNVLYLYAYVERADIKEKGTLFFRARLTKPKQ